jgi:hypothetical protein
MNAQTVAQATQLGNGTVAILVDTENAESLHASLKAQGVNCAHPSGAIFKPARLMRNGAGQIYREDEAIVHEILAKGTLRDFEQWMAKWVAPPKKSEPSS